MHKPGCATRTFRSMEMDTFDESPDVDGESPEEEDAEDGDPGSGNAELSESRIVTDVDLKEQVTKDLSDNLYSFYGYALDVLCIPEKSAMELTSRVEGIVSNLSQNISVALTAPNGSDGKMDTSFFHPIPSMTVKRDSFDEYLQKKSHLSFGNEILCSNGDEFTYIPLENYIKFRFQREEKEFDVNHEYFKSNYYREHIKPMNNENNRVVHFLLYCDEFDVCNPIGVSRTKHKLFAVYFKVLNFNVRHTSSLDAIKLIMLLKSSTLKAVGIDEVFSPLINELNDLYFKGVAVNGTIYYAMADAMCGDNLSNNFVGGFSLSFCKGQFCRFCTIAGGNVVSNLSETFEMRERSHATIVSDSFEKKNGMAFVSPFLDLPYVKMPFFFPPDIFHDLFEGVSHFILCTALNSLLKRKVTTIEIINKIFKENSPFSPAIIKMHHLHNGHLPFSGSQMVHWLQFFCAHFGCLFDPDDEWWELVTTHCEIVEIMSSIFLCSDSKCEHLRYLIVRQNDLVLSLNASSIKYKCKFHNLCHYPNLMKLYGNLAYFSTIRFEGLHQYFKRLVRVVRQFKSLPKLLTYRYQRRCATLSDEPFQRPVLCGSTSLCDVKYLDEQQRACLLDFCCCTSFEFPIISSEHIIYCGYDYYTRKKQSVIVLSVDNVESDPVFWIINEILYIKGSWMLLLQKLMCSYEPHFRIYIINNRTTEYLCTRPDSPLHRPLEVFLLGGFQSIALKHVINSNGPF